MSRSAVVSTLLHPVSLVALVLLLGAPSPVLAQDDGSSPRLIVYRRGETLRYDPDVGADLKEVILETWDCSTGERVETEQVEAYFHLSEDGEIINPDAVCEDCHRVFTIEREEDLLFFRGPRPEPAPDEEPAAAPAPPEPLTSTEVVENLRGKLQEVARQIAAIPADRFRSATERRRIITAEVTLPLHDMDREALTRVVAILCETEGLSDGDRYYVVRSFGWEMYMEEEFERALPFYERCIEIHPGWGSARYQKALSHWMLREWDRAIHSFVEALQATPRARYAERLLQCLESVTRTERLTSEDVDDLHRLVEDLRRALEEENRGGGRSLVSDIAERVREPYADLE